ncbi:MAG TPA: ABC transporter substrate-binding protein [Candidatus Sulfotelmatobacter sp.]|nr:ABC transporter substrate-binding protein [Candidatus Sulfotelmatobacter sp.]
MRTRALLAAMLLAALAGCVGRAAQPLPPDELRLAISTEPHSLDPILAESIQDNEIDRLVFDPLIACDAQGRPVPALAVAVPTRQNGGISADGTRITYRLRHGVRWSDGRPFTAADVLASFRAVMDPRNPVQTRHGYDQVVRVETPDPYTVVFRLRRPFAPFVGTVFAESDAPYYLAPAALLHGPLTRSTLGSAPVGTGPYRLVRWVRGDRLELAANPRYWGGAPSIPRISVHFIPDENSQLVGLRTGELDAVIGISANAAAGATDIPHVHVATAPLNAYYGIMMNTARAPTNDLRVRRGIAEAMDAAAFRANVTHGLYAPAIADLPVALWAADRQLPPIRHDPADARRLFAAAGYGPSHPLALDLAIIGNYHTHQVEAVALQSELHALGVEVHIHPYVGNQYDAPPESGGILSRGRYDIAIYGWYAGMDPDDSGQFMCDQRPPNGYDHSFYCSAAMDAAQRDALRSYDEPARRAAYARVEALLLRDVPIAFLASPVAISAIRDDLTGFSPTLVTQDAGAQRWQLRR